MKPAPGSAASEEREKSRRIGSLRALGPFLAPYKAMLAAAFAALVLTAVVSLTLPLAVRRVVDGFETSSTELLDKYFLALLGVAIVFAGGAALRFYLVTRLGERVVADIRKAVFDRMIGMSPAFFEKHHDGRGAQPDHHRHDADLLSVILVGLHRAAELADPDRRSR
jgi:ATP-binding cassette subfamily B protein